MSELYFRQIPAGPMQNFVYVIGCEESHKCVLVDPAWDVDGLLGMLDEDQRELVGVFVTHYHPDHCGGSMFGMTVEGLPELMAKRPVPVHVHEAEAEGFKQVTGLEDSDLRKHSSGDRVRVGEVQVELLHTPGHTPGSQCFRVKNCLVSGDTLFLQGCGRVDLPGGDPDELHRSIQRLAELPDETILYPGHHYSPESSAPMSEVKRENHFLRVASLEDWKRLMGGGV